MARNIEIKAKSISFEAQMERARNLADGPEAVLHQEDIFFHGASGRLKLRIMGSDRGELIAYDRPDQAGPKSSDYLISPTTDPRGLEQVLTRSLNVRGVVRKKRTLFMAGQTRIHMDEVEDLGRFMELEVVLKPGQTNEEGQAIARSLMEKLGIEEDHLLEKAYIDLLEEGKGS